MISFHANVGESFDTSADPLFDRVGDLLDMSEGEVRGRCTFTGGVEIDRLPGVVQLNMLAPMDRLEDRGIVQFVRNQYDLQAEGTAL